MTFEKQVLYNINNNFWINLRNVNRNLNTSAANSNIVYK